MEKLLVLLLLIFGPFGFSQTKLIGFSTAGEINSSNSGGLVWQMNLDGTGFQVLKKFHDQKPFYPSGNMVVAPDGKGYGFAEGYGFDAGRQVLYQFDFATKSYSLIKVYNDSPWALSLLLGSDGALYACRQISNQQTIVCRLSFAGEVEDELYTINFEGDVTGLIQASNGKIIVTLEKTAEEIWILGGNSDGSDWETLLHFEPNIEGNYISNLVAQNDFLYGTIWQYNSLLRFFKIRTDGQDLSFFQPSAVADFGEEISLAIGANDVFYALAQKGPSQIFYQIQTDGQTAPVKIFEDSIHGHIQTKLTADALGNLYYHSAKINSNSQSTYLLKILPGTNNPHVLANLASNTTQDLYLHILVHPNNDRLYVWKRNIESQLSTLLTCKTNGSGLTSLYNLTTGLPDVGSSLKALILGSDGNYYGMMTQGGLKGAGLIFVIKPNGSGFSVLHELLPAITPTMGWEKPSIPTFFEGSDGLLYGSSGNDNVFRLQKNGSEFTLLHTSFHHRTNFIEHSDGRLYWGGKNLMRMDKDGSNQTVVSGNFITPFSYYDFCELFELPNGKIAGAGSYTVDGDCFDYFTYPLYFSFDLATNHLQKREDYFIQNSNTMVSPDGNLYYGKGKYDPELNQLSSYQLGCAFFPDLPNGYQLANPVLQATNGFIYGNKTRGEYSDDRRWLPMAWSVEDGNCEMSINWDPTLGFDGKFAFEIQSTSSPTLQPAYEAEITLSPNPTSNSARLSLIVDLPTPFNLTVLDLMGRRVFESNQTVAAGAQTFEIPASAISAKGIYNVVLKTEIGTWSKLLLVN